MFVFLLEYIHFLEYILCQSRVVIHAYRNNLDVVKLKLSLCILWHGCLTAEPVVFTLFEELLGYDTANMWLASSCTGCTLNSLLVITEVVRTSHPSTVVHRLVGSCT